MTRADLQGLAEMRLREAQVLLAAGEYSGAYYLAGYAVECALKACIAKSTQAYDFPDKKRVNDSHTHKLQDLLKTANLEQALQEYANGHLGFNANWAIVIAWSEESRYRTWQQGQAESLLSAISDAEHG